METSIFVIAIIAAQGFNAPATEHAARAFVAQNQLDVKLDRYSRSLTTTETRRRLDNIAIVTQAVVERKVVFKWEY